MYTHTSITGAALHMHKQQPAKFGSTLTHIEDATLDPVKSCSWGYCFKTCLAYAMRWSPRRGSRGLPSPGYPPWTCLPVPCQCISSQAGSPCTTKCLQLLCRPAQVLRDCGLDLGVHVLPRRVLTPAPPETAAHVHTHALYCRRPYWICTGRAEMYASKTFFSHIYAVSCQAWTR